MTDPQRTKTLSFPAAKSSDIGMKAFMVLHALSLAAIAFAGALGFLRISTPKVMAIAGLISIGLALVITFVVHQMISARRQTSDDPDILRLTPQGLEGRALAERGIPVLDWERLISVTLSDHAIELHFNPTDISSPNPADRIGAVRIAQGPTASARAMKEAIETHPARP